MRTARTVEAAERSFWGHVEKGDGCWRWQSAKSASGYGIVRHRRRTMLAHRVAYELTHGPIPQGEGYHGTCVCHRCDTPACVNPDHLFLGTNTENMRDMAAKGRGGGYRAQPGEAHHSAKLSNADCSRIVVMLEQGLSERRIAVVMGVAQSTVHRAAKRIARGTKEPHQ